MMSVQMLAATDSACLDHVADDVFDFAVDARWTAAFLADPRHHLAVALDDGLVVGMASAVHYVHPDKAPQLWINEVGVAPTYQRQGLGRRLMATLLTHGAALGCTEAWVGTEDSNVAAQQLYQAVGGVPDPAPFVVYTFALAPTKNAVP